MKKLSIALAALTLGVQAFAQATDTTEPNRLLVVDNIDQYKGYVLDRVKEISFAKVDGEAKAEVKFLEFLDREAISVSVTKSEQCNYYNLAILPSIIANRLTDPLQVISYLNRGDQPVFWDDYTNGEMSGFTLDYDTDYTLLTVGYDYYGVADGVCRDEFHTPKAVIEGDPKVTCVYDSIGKYEFTCTFTPNDDVTSYYYVAGDKGSLERQYEQFAPMFGYANFEQMIMAWGVKETEVSTFTWKNMDPNTEYEIFVVCLDWNDNAAPAQCFTLSTLALGGKGEASVAMELGEYKLTDWGGEQKYSQFITYTPNDQSAAYRFAVYKAETYNAEEAKAYVCSEPPMPDMSGWFFYDPLTTDYQIDPGTEAVAVAAAKNIDGQWGPVTELRFTTPDVSRSTVTSNSAIRPRIKAQPARGSRQGMLPILNEKKTITLK